MVSGVVLDVVHNAHATNLDSIRATVIITRTLFVGKDLSVQEVQTAFGLDAVCQKI